MSFASRHLLAASLVLLLGQATGREPAGPKDQEIERLVQQLASETFEDREAAARQLEEIGEPAWLTLKKATRDLDAEVRRRAAVLLEDITGHLHARGLVIVKASGGKVRIDEKYSPPDISIDLSGTKIKDADLVQVKWIRGLTELNLSETQVTDAGLAHLKGLPLSYLALARSEVGDTGLAYLQGMRTLGTLDLSGTRVTDAGLAYLKGLHRLHILLLSDTRITDSGLAHLYALEGTSIYLTGTKVTEKAADELEKAAPYRSIHRSR
jgi:hypothetical protein